MRRVFLEAFLTQRVSAYRMYESLNLGFNRNQIGVEERIVFSGLSNSKKNQNYFLIFHIDYNTDQINSYCLLPKISIH